MGIFDTRRLRLAKLIRDDFGDNQAAFSRHVDIKASQVNRWLSTTAEKRPVINEISARQIEEKCLKSPGWLDSESDQPILSKHAQECAAIINQMTPEEQHDFLFYLRTEKARKELSEGSANRPLPDPDGPENRPGQ